MLNQAQWRAINMKREATCLCGQLSLCVEGEPTLSMVCNCTNCQRRTGSAFGTITYFADSQVIEQKGKTKNHRFKVDSGNTNTTSFCPNCGTTVFFKAEMFQGQTGIASGCFRESERPEPRLAAWTRSKCQWVEFPEHWPRLAKQSPS